MLIAWLIFMLEWVMERLVNRNPEIWAIRYGRVARFILAITSWVTVLPLRLMGESNKPGEIANTLTQDDFETLVDTGQEEGLLEREEGRMIISIVRLGETLAREIMVPRIDMVALDVSVKPEQAVDIMLQSGHSRVPVYEDTIDKILGVLYVKDLLRVYCSETRDKSLREIIRPAYFIPEAKHLDTLLAEMQAGRIHMAIVVDEYGGIAGLVTLEDIVEEIVGEIQDEYDQEEELPYQILENGDYLFQGRFDLDAFNEMMGSNLDTEEADTLAGYIYSQLGRVPFVGEKVQHDNLLLTVEQVSARRIRKIRSSWLQPESSSPQGEPIQNEDQKGSSSEPRVIRSMRLSDNDKVEGLEGTHGAY
jgi:CBS domain containing-hemolysin-like protein